MVPRSVGRRHAHVNFGTGEPDVTTEEIPRGLWERFCSEFSHEHEGRQVNVETSCWETCSILELARHLPLAGVSVEASGQEEMPAISVYVGKAPQPRVVRRIASPSRLSLKRREDGAPTALRIESEDGIVTMVRFLPRD